MNPNYKNFANYAFQNLAEKIQVYLPMGTTKTSSYDKYRDVGYAHNLQNYFTVNAILRDTKPETLAFKQIGLIGFGWKWITVKNNDVELIKLSQKLIINGDEYYVYSDAIGNKMQITPADFGYSVILVARKNK